MLGPFKHGYSDFCAGIDVNPFKPGTEDYLSWWDGYCEAIDDYYENCSD